MSFTLTGREQHPDWCARGHHCGLGEHRSTPITLDAPGRGLVVLTRVRAQTGREYVEIRLRVGLPGNTIHARTHLAQLVIGLDAFLAGVTRLKC
jgi:hypothetical protein